MYKMIAIDIDDTLINDDKQVTEGTKQALEAALAKNVVVTLATGRMYASANALAAQLGLHVPLITYQGALVKTAMDGEVLYERYVPLEATRIVFDYCQSHDLHLQTYINDQLYVQESNEKAESYAALSKIPFIVEPDFAKLAQTPSLKLLIIDDPDKLDRAALELRELIGPGVHITKSKPYFLEIMHAEGTKGHALAHLAGHFGFDLEQVIAVGDSWNDHELLETAGLGVAVDNAVDSLKAIADYITLSNNEDGVKHVIDKFILQTV
ncbi:Cof-type HAD-IIB family hydrolase [Paenibacillus puerhi]|uniref:Cof-type HAD-IIB family hydrolase n=1 Tax=Paenibacillus puerhi TaxID=2692622 RepID=UPI00135C2BC3|nr:Cof-type HAD-IIB family hydrolase [Paenibacillus puerhi]